MTAEMCLSVRMWSLDMFHAAVAAVAEAAIAAVAVVITIAAAVPATAAEAIDTDIFVKAVVLELSLMK